MALEHKVKTTNLLDDIEEELFKSLKIKISFNDNEDNETNEDNEKETTKE